MIRIFVFATLFIWGALPSAAESVTKSYSYFSVGGTTRGEIEKELIKRGPEVNNTGQRHPGATRRVFDMSLVYAQDNGACSIVKANVAVKAEVILPRWTQSSKADQETKLWWDALSIDIKRHEDQHVRMAADYARRLERRAMGIGRQRDCATAANLAKLALDTILTELEAADVEFDRIEEANFDKRLLRIMRQRLRMIQRGEIPG